MTKRVFGGLAGIAAIIVLLFGAAGLTSAESTDARPQSLCRTLHSACLRQQRINDAVRAALRRYGRPDTLEVPPACVVERRECGFGRSSSASSVSSGSSRSPVSCIAYCPDGTPYNFCAMSPVDPCRDHGGGRSSSSVPACQGLTICLKGYVSWCDNGQWRCSLMLPPTTEPDDACREGPLCENDADCAAGLRCMPHYRYMMCLPRHCPILR